MKEKGKRIRKTFICRKRIFKILAFAAVIVMMQNVVFAGQQSGYHDPALEWMQALNRTNELEINSVVTKESFLCYSCMKETTFDVYRVPEYTLDGRTVLNNNIKYSDGTYKDGSGQGDTREGIPGQDSYYTGYHWSATRF
ncbi:MAG: hypothetical protein HFE90_00905 [Firmicutes bacterium]|nr:hypothetical protein [Bacillota bacterium]